MPKNKVTVTQFRDDCIGCGMCAFLCPKHWRMNEEDGMADLIDSEKVRNFYKKEVDFEDLESNKEAAQNCPVNIIKVDD